MNGFFCGFQDILGSLYKKEFAFDTYLKIYSGLHFFVMKNTLIITDWRWNKIAKYNVVMRLCTHVIKENYVEWVQSHLKFSKF